MRIWISESNFWISIRLSEYRSDSVLIFLNIQGSTGWFGAKLLPSRLVQFTRCSKVPPYYESYDSNIAVNMDDQKKKSHIDFHFSKWVQCVFPSESCTCSHTLKRLKTWSDFSCIIVQVFYITRNHSTSWSRCFEVHDPTSDMAVKLEHLTCNCLLCCEWRMPASLRVHKLLK